MSSCCYGPTARPVAHAPVSPLAGFPLIVVLFVLLILVGCGCFAGVAKC